MSGAVVVKISGSVDAVDKARAIGVSKTLTPAQVVHAAHGDGFLHVVQEDGPSFDAEMAAAKTMIEQPALYFSDPLSAILGPCKSSALQDFRVDYKPNTKKAEVLSSFADYLAPIPRINRVWDSAILIADELFTNGAKNAWRKDSKLFDGPPVFAGMVEFFTRAAGDRLVIGCRDSFGELDVNSVLTRISACYTNGVAESIRRGQGGAGIGSFMVFNACTSYYAGVNPGHETVVCVVLPLGIGMRQLEALPKNIHLLTRSAVMSAVDGGKKAVS